MSFSGMNIATIGINKNKGTTAMATAAMIVYASRMKRGLFIVLKPDPCDLFKPYMPLRVASGARLGACHVFVYGSGRNIESARVRWGCAFVRWQIRIMSGPAAGICRTYCSTVGLEPNAEDGAW